VVIFHFLQVVRHLLNTVLVVTVLVHTVWAVKV